MSWERIRGHREVVRRFVTAYVHDRLGQAYMLVGPEGVGKRLFARELAKAVLCERPREPLTACDACPSCLQVAADTHPDLLTLRTPEGRHELPVETMREFCGRLALKPVRGGRRVGLIEDADDFNPESANCFLKTLEEPPVGTLLLLVTTSTERHLPTVLSRCQVVRFGPLAAADVAEVLAQVGIDDPGRRERLARRAGGSVARALALNDEATWQTREDLLRGLTDSRPDFARLAEVWEQYVAEAGKDTAAQRTRAAVVTGFLLDALGSALRLAYGAKTDEADPSETERLRAFAERVGPDRLLELIEACLEADRRIERRVQVVLVIESVLDQWTRMSRG